MVQAFYQVKEKQIQIYDGNAINKKEWRMMLTDWENAYIEAFLTGKEKVIIKLKTFIIKNS